MKTARLLLKALLVSLAAVIAGLGLISCSDGTTHKGTIKSHGILYYDPLSSVTVINTTILPTKRYFAIKLIEYPKITFIMDLYQGKNYSGYKELEDIDKNLKKTPELFSIMPEVESNRKISLKCKETNNKNYYNIIIFKEN